MGETGVIFGIVGMWCGFVALRSLFQIKKTGDIKKSVLYPNSNGLVKRCKDKEAYIKETIPKLLVIGIAAEFYGAVEIFHAVVMPVGGLLVFSMIATGIIIIWAAIGAKKMNEKYF